MERSNSKEPKIRSWQTWFSAEILNSPGFCRERPEQKREWCTGRCMGGPSATRRSSETLKRTSRPSISSKEEAKVANQEVNGRRLGLRLGWR